MMASDASRPGAQAFHARASLPLEQIDSALLSLLAKVWRLQRQALPWISAALRASLPA
jgi:hypothetical protein